MENGDTGTMTAEPSYFDMGGYAAYIWPAYGVTLAALAILVIWTVKSTRAVERKAAKLRRGTDS